MGMKVLWSDSMEKLAYAMFSMAPERQDPFDTECTVVGSPVMAGWLKQYFLFDYPADARTNRVLACWDFKMLHPFVNDWVMKACRDVPVGARDPSSHAYSREVLHWRVWNELLKSREEAPEYDVLRSYIGTDEDCRDIRRWGLAARIAQLFDDYQNYRSDVLRDWQNGKHGNVPGTFEEARVWQSRMWRSLQEQESDTYPSLFADLPEKLKSSGIADAYTRITVFHAPALPGSYMSFFCELGRIMDVQMFIFNPSKDFWIEDPTVKGHIKKLIQSSRERASSPESIELEWMTPPHPILSGFGRGTQAFLGTLLDVTDGDPIVDEALWAEDKDATILQKVQADIRRGKMGAGDLERHTPLQLGVEDDGSIQFHECHGPQRELEVARDLILKWFEEHPDSQPRDVQVLVPDMETYAPFIESVFRVNDSNSPVPAVVSKRPPVSAGSVGAAFAALMALNEKRMTATEVVELLELDPVRERYGLDPEDLGTVRNLVNEAGIRWGRDAAHIAGVLGEGGDAMPDTVTWRRGLDRLLAGFALGRLDGGGEVAIVGELGVLKVYDGVEGHTAMIVGRLGRYFEDLCETADDIASKRRRKVSEWADFYSSMLERFFKGTDTSFIEIAQIRRGIEAVRRAAAAESAGDPEITSDVMSSAIEAQLGGMAPAGKAEFNAVLFSPMQTMQVTPRKMIVMLGLNEGVFPRADNRPAFDLMAAAPRYGDRSARYEDRLAFLEGIMCAGSRLIITYTGMSAANNNEIPPSPAVTEFMQYLNAGCGAAGSEDQPLIRAVKHKLHAFNPAYYAGSQDKAKLFSFSKSNYSAALALLNTSAGEPVRAVGLTEPGADGGSRLPGTVSEATVEITVEALQEFFVNPARHYFTERLGIWLPDPARDCLSDVEKFDDDSLTDYELNRIFIADILASAVETADDFQVSEDYFRKFQEESLVRPGRLGLLTASRKLDELKKFLGSPSACCADHTIFDMLKDLRDRGRTDADRVEVECGGYRISAQLPVLVCQKRRFLFLFRYAAVKANDRLRGWLLHLIGHAKEGMAFNTHVIGKTVDDGASYPPLTSSQALKILGGIIDWYRKGQDRVLPFAPNTSYAYWDTRRNTKDAYAAYEGAVDAWSGYGFPEFRDRYLFEVWKADGPMADVDFMALTEEFWGGYDELETVEGAADQMEPGAAEAEGADD